MNKKTITLKDIVLNTIVEEDPFKCDYNPNQKLAITLDGEIDANEWLDETRNGENQYSMRITCRSGKCFKLYRCTPVEILKGVNQFVVMHFDDYSRTLKSRWFTV